MKHRNTCTLGLVAVVTGMLAGSAAAQDAKEAVTAAAAKLGEGSYKWTSTMSFGEDRQFSTAAARNKDGFAVVEVPRRDGPPRKVVLHGDQGVVEVDGAWRTADELEADETNRGSRFLARMIERYELPHDQAAELAGQVSELSQGDGGSYTGAISEEGLSDLLSFGRRGRDNDGDSNRPQPTDQSGTASFTVNDDGVLTSFEYTVSGTFTRDGESRQFQRTSKVEISEIGTAQVDVPAEAAAKLGGGGAAPASEAGDDAAEDNAGETEAGDDNA